MKKLKKAFILAFTATGVITVTGCSEDVIDVSSDVANDYYKSFIEKYGVPQAGHDFNMAKLGSVTVRTDKPTDITVVSTVEGVNYFFAKAFGVNGEKTITFDIPRDVNYVSVIANNRAYTARLGDLVSIDCFRQSRGNEGTDTKIELNSSKYRVLEYQVNSSINGYIDATKYNSEDVEANLRPAHDYNMLGSEMKQYVLDEASNYTGYANEEYTSRHTREYIFPINLKSGEGKRYEMGKMFGNSTFLGESTEFMLVPLMYNFDNENTGEVDSRVPSDSFNRWGHDITIDYNATSGWDNGIDGGYGGVISSQALGVSDFAEFRNILNVAQFRAQIEAYANAQEKYNMPVPQDMYAGDSQFADAILEPYEEENPYKFYNQWNDYINAWIDAQPADVKAQFASLDFIKEFMAVHEIRFKENARPSVKKLGEGKFRIDFYDSCKGGTGANEILRAGLQNSIVDHMAYTIGGLYRVNIPGEDSDTDETGTEFAYYVRDLDNGAIVTTTDKSRVKTTYRHSSYVDYNGKHNKYEQQVIMVDLDGDQIYNDMVFIAEPVVYGTGVPFRWRLAAEDLGSTEDNDFNDLVVDIDVNQYGNDAQYIHVGPQAAGGIYPLYLMFTDTRNNTFFVGQEIHKWLGQSDYEIFNTGETTSIGWGTNQAKIKYDLSYQTQPFQISTHYNVDMGQNSTIGGFWVLVDKNNILDDKLTLDVENPSLMTAEIKALIDADPDIYQVNNDPKYGTANAMVPQLILATNSWCWPRETVDIGDAYEKFSSWVQDRNTVWFGSNAEGVHDDLVTQPAK